MKSDLVLENPTGVINSLQARIQQLERQHELEAESVLQNHELRMVDCLNYLRAHGIISLYVGRQEFDKTCEAILRSDSTLGAVMDAVWDLSKAPIAESVKLAILDAADQGNTRW